MTCDEAEILLHALIDGELDAGHAREVEAHIASCARCAAAARDYTEAITTLEALQKAGAIEGTDVETLATARKELAAIGAR